MDLVPALEAMIDRYYTGLTGKDGVIGYLFAIVPTLVVLASAALFVINIVFGSPHDKNRKIHMVFLGRFFRVVVIVICVIGLLLGYNGLPRLALFLSRSTLIFGGIIGIAGQDIIKDILGGFMLSIYKPFEIGDRIMLTDVPRPVLVEDITMRHAVLRAMDGMRFIVPNSEMNKYVIQHTSYKQKPRATYLYVPISYDSDIRLAIELMREAVKNCPYTCPGNANNYDLDGYGDVYLHEIQDSAFQLNMTVWSEPETDNDLCVSESYQAIINAFIEHGIEMPYNYINVIDAHKAKKEISRVQESAMKKISGKDKKNIGRRDVRVSTDKVEMSVKESVEEKVIAARKKAERFAAFYEFDATDTNIIVLLSEELLDFSAAVLGDLSGKFWIEGVRDNVRIHIKEPASLNFDAMNVLLDLSSNGDNSANIGIVDSIRQKMALLSTGREQDVTFQLNELGDENELGKMLLTKLSDKITVSMKAESVHITVYWEKKS